MADQNRAVIHLTAQLQRLLKRRLRYDLRASSGTIDHSLKQCRELAVKGRTKTLRYRLLYTATRLVRGQHKRTISIPGTWPWPPIYTPA